MHLTLVGLSHKTAPIEIREKLTFPAQRQEDALALLISTDDVVEAIIVSTCNRTEIYAVTAAGCDGPGAIIDFIADFHDLDRHELVRYLYIIEGEAVVRHLFRVVASLDSMVVGEAQILGQVKEAYEHGFEYQATGRVFNKLFRQSFEVGKRVRTETAIGEAAVSVSYAAVELAKRVFDTLEGRTVLILGAGKMSELTAKHLCSHGICNVLVANRTLSRAEELAQRFNGLAVPYESLYDHLAKADIVISSTAATEYVVTKDALSKAMRGRRGNPLFLIDIALPRDIDPAVNELDDAYLYDLDSLNGVVESNLDERMREAERAEAIIAEEMAAFEAWLESMEVVPTIAAIRANAEKIRQAELEKALKRMGGLSAKELETIDRLTCAIVNKMLHDPTSRLKEVAGQRYGIGYIEAARHLYGLDTAEAKTTPRGLLRSLLGKKGSTEQPSQGEIGDSIV